MIIITSVENHKFRNSWGTDALQNILGSSSASPTQVGIFKREYSTKRQHQGSEFCARTMRLIYAPNCGIILSEFIEFDGESIAEPKCSIWVLSPALPKCQRNLFTLNYNYDFGLVITRRNNFQSAIWSFSGTSILYLVSSGSSPLLSQAVVVQRHSRLRTLIVDLLPLFAATWQRNEAPKLGPQLIAA